MIFRKSQLPALPPRGNLLIPCGTSQLDEAKWRKILALPARAAAQVEHANNDSLRTSASAYLQEPTVANAIDEFVRRLLDYFPRRSELVPAAGLPRWWEKNPFGAELSTLIRLEGGWDPQQDRVVLIASKSQAGVLSQRILARVLQDERGYGVKDVQEVQLEHLHENANELGKVDEELAETLSQEMQRPRSQFLPRLVITGGFKTLIPGLTLAALLYGAEMVYLFERSTVVHHMQFIEQDQPRHRQAWEKALEGLRRQGVFADQAGVLRDLLARWERRPRPVPDLDN